MIKYRTNYRQDGIEKVECLRETDKCVFLWKNRVRRENKESNGVCYFDSFQDAKDYLISLAHQRVVAAENNFVRECDKRDKIESLTDN